MSISLTKNQTIDLTKKNGSKLTKVFLGAGWDVAKSSGGFLGRIFGGGGSDSIDLDASLITLDANKNELETVYFGNLRNKNRSIIHSGDNLTGEGDGDDEVIHVDLEALPSDVKTLVFTISSFRGQDFSSVSNAFVRLVDSTTNEEIAKYNISEQGKYTSLIIAKIERASNGWVMTALGHKTQGSHISQLVSTIQTLV